MTEYGKKLLLAKDAAEFKRLLGISSEGIWDEGQTRWQGTAYTTAAESYSGSKSLYLAGMQLQTAAPVTFGGDPFSIKFWLKKGGLPLSTTYNVFRALGTTSSFGMQVQSGPSASNILVNVARGTTGLTTNGLTITTGYTSTDWRSFEFNYDGAGKLKCLFNGSASKQSGTDGNPISLTVQREPRRLYFGAFNGYVDEFELIDNGVTISKLDFEQVTL